MQDWLAQHAGASPDKIALIFEGQQRSYRELNRLTADLCARLSAAGIKRGDHVAVLAGSSLQTVVLIHALARSGAIMVPLNTRLTTGELRFQLDSADCASLLHDSSTQEQAGALATDVPAYLLETLPEAGNPADWQHSDLDLDAVQGIVFTSGTTGKPKGAMLTYRNHLMSAAASAYRLGTQPDDCWLACMPLYHVGGQAVILRACQYGIAVELHDGFDAEAVNRSLDSGGVTIVSVVPTMLQRLLDERDERPFHPHLRCILMGGAAASKRLLERCQRLDLPVSLTYGLTEAASQVATTAPQDMWRKPGSVGKALFGSRLKIEGNDGSLRPANTIGEIVVNGETVMLGYYRQPEATAEILKDGWLHTGDMGYLDDDGDLWVVQRRSDLVVSGGENIYPAEVEEALLTHPGIEAACVVGLDNPDWGQMVVAVIVRRDNLLTADEITAHCRSLLAGYKLPRIIRFAESLPSTASGKVKREVVRDFIKETIVTSG